HLLLRCSSLCVSAARSSPFVFPVSATTEISPLSLHDALPISDGTVPMLPGRFSVPVMCGAAGSLDGVSTLDDVAALVAQRPARPDRKSTRLNSSHVSISYAVFCLKKKKSKRQRRRRRTNNKTG